MTTIDCPGSVSLSSSKTRTSTGVFTDSNSKNAINEARNAVLKDLVDQVNAASCADGCFKVTGDTSTPEPTVRCKRNWWTLWIVVECSATASGNVTVECKVQG